jgi:hypothetical protein
MSQEDVQLSNALRIALCVASILGGAVCLRYYVRRSAAKGIHLFAACGIIMGVLQLANALLNTPSHILYCDGNAARLKHSRTCMAIGLLNVRSLT